MTATMLRLCEGIDFPLSTVTEPLGIFGQRGYGKTWTAVDLVEELYAAGLPSVILDIKGDWWGIRSSVDGKRDGLPFLIIGGDHADVPLEQGRARAIARFIAERNVPAVVDLSELSKTKARQWAMEFAEELYDLKRRLRSPLMLVVDEADVLIPQRLSADLMRLLGAMEDIAKRGRQRGLGICVVTQRVADVNKSVTDLLTTLIVHAVTGVRTRKALMEWINDHARDADSVEEVLSSLSRLEPGEAWVWSPGFLRLLKRVRMRRITTYDSHATPEPGQQIEMPRRMADIDVSSLSADLAEAIERAKADDPAELRKQIADLKRQLAARPAAEPERVEVPVLTDDDRELVGSIAKAAEGMATLVTGGVERWVTAVDGLTAKVAGASGGPSRPAAPTVTRTPPARAKATVTQQATPPRAAVRTDRTSPEPAGSIDLTDTERLLLTTLAQRHPIPMTMRELAVRARRSHTSSTTKTAVSRLRSLGLAEGSNGHLTATPAGIDETGGVEPMPTGPALLAWWQGRLTAAEYALLFTIAHEQTGLTDQEAYVGAGFSPTSSTPKTALSRLRGLGLVNKSNGVNVAVPELQEAARG